MMEPQAGSDKGNVFELSSQGKKIPMWGKPITKGRYLMGSSEACDIFIMHSSVAPVHCLIESNGSEVTLYNLNVGLGTTVNNENIVKKSLAIGDQVKIGKFELCFQKWSYRDDLPILPDVSPDYNSEKVRGSVRNQPFAREDDPSSETKATDVSAKGPRIIYPFSVDYNFDTSEYIFEETDRLYPIFKYHADKSALEVIIVFKNRILSVDYIGDSDGTYYLAGVGKGKGAIEFSYLPKNDKVAFLEVRGREFFLHNLYEFTTHIFSDNAESKKKSKEILLENKEIINLVKGNISIVIRRVESPPEVLLPPVLPRDKSVMWLALMAFIMVSLPMYFLAKREVDQDEINKIKAPERVATILYNKPKIKEPVKPSKTKPKPVEKPPQPKVEKVQEKKEAPKKIADQPVKKPAPKKTPQKGAPPKADNVKATAAPAKTATSKPSKRPSAQPTKSKSSPSVTSSPTPTSKGTVDVYKSDKFKSTVSALVAKGGQIKSATTKGVSGGSPSASVGSTGMAGSAGVKTATSADKIGDRTGALQGAQDFSSGAQGLVTGKGFITAGIPSETVILGSMDPDLIRKILRDHLPQFRFCYQKELDRSGNTFSGALKVVFTIGASGNVSNAGVDGASSLPAAVRGCVINVLRGIRFPRPAGGGVVEVKQPINFYPKQ